MLNASQRAVLLDRQHRKVISSMADIPFEEQEFPEEQEWRRAHTQHHYTREAMLILSGSHSVQLNGRTYSGEPNTLVIVNSREAHDARYYPACGDCSHLWIFIRANRITCQGDRVHDGKFRVLFQYAVEDTAKYKELNNIFDAYDNGMIDPGTALFGICAMLDEMIFDLLTQKKLLEQGLSSREIAVVKVKNYINNTLGRGCSVSLLAELAGYSPVHFQRLFFRITGKTVGEYINDVRRKHFEEMKDICPFKVIAEDLGFSGLPAFSAWLKKNREKAVK